MLEIEPPSAGVTPGSPPWPTKNGLARLATEILAPAPVVTALLVVMAVKTAPSGQALTWGGISILFTSVVPMAYVVRGVRRKRFTDHHIPDRSQRLGPMLVALASVSIAILVLAYLGAPRPLIALAIAGVVGLGVMLAITLFWKISLHTAVLAGNLTIVVIVFGPWWLPLASLILLVAWARIHTKAHTPMQTTAGAILGSVIAAAVFLGLR